MKRVAVILFGLMAISAGSFAQSSGQEIEKALLAAPAQMRDGTMVIRWGDDFTYETLKPGTNRLVCYDRSGQPTQQPFSIECTSVTNLERVAQNMRTEAANPEADARRAAFEALERRGSWIKPEFGSLFINFSGPSQAQARFHTTVAVPGATAESLGLPDTAASGGAWIMNAGTSAAHIMVPGS